MKLAEWEDGFVLNADPRRADPLYYYMRDEVWDSAIGLEVEPRYEEQTATEVTLSVFSEHLAREKGMAAPERRKMYGRVISVLLRCFPKWSRVTLRSDYLPEILEEGSVQAAFKAAGFAPGEIISRREQSWTKAHLGPAGFSSRSIISHWWIIALGAWLGILITMWIDESTKTSYPPGQGARPAEWAMMPFWGLYVLSTHLLAPWDIMRRRNARVPGDIQAGRMVIYPWWSWLFLGPYFLKDQRAKVPAPISALLVAVVCILCAWLFLIFSILGVIGLHAGVAPSRKQVMQRIGFQNQTDQSQ